MKEGTRYIREADACEYTSMSRAYFRAWAVKIGARRQLGKRLVLYDREVIDAALKGQKQHD